MSRIHRSIKVEPPSPLVKTLVSTEVHRWGRPWWRFISFVTATAVSTIAGCSQRHVAAPCCHLRSRRFSPSSSSHPAAAARRFPSDIRSCPPLRLAPGVATVPFRWTGGALCVHTLTGFACIGSPPASLPCSLLTRAGRHGISLVPREKHRQTSSDRSQRAYIFRMYPHPSYGAAGPVSGSGGLQGRVQSRG